MHMKHILINAHPPHAPYVVHSQSPYIQYVFLSIIPPSFTLIITHLSTSATTLPEGMCSLALQSPVATPSGCALDTDLSNLISLANDRGSPYSHYSDTGPRHDCPHIL